MALRAEEEFLIDFKWNLDKLSFWADAYCFGFSKSLERKKLLIPEKLTLFKCLKFL